MNFKAYNYTAAVPGLSVSTWLQQPAAARIPHPQFLSTENDRSLSEGRDEEQERSLSNEALPL